MLKVSSLFPRSRVSPGLGVGDAGEHIMDVGEKPGTRQASSVIGVDPTSPSPRFSPAYLPAFSGCVSEVFSCY